MFLGGTAGGLREILRLALQKNPRVRIVATAVTLESAGALSACMAEFETASCAMVQISRSSAAGPYQLMKAQNPVFVFTLQNANAPLT